MKKLFDAINLTVIGILYICAGIFILIWPQLIYYGVALVFIIHGLITLLRLLRKK